MMEPTDKGYAYDTLTISVSSYELLAVAERIIGTLRHRRYNVEHVSISVDANSGTIMITGRALHGGDRNAMIVRRLRRLPGVVSVALADRESAPLSG
jgi:hypothetical protein